MKIISYNVNGIRAAVKKGFIDWLKTHPADVICIQENKAQQSDVDSKLFNELGPRYANRNGGYLRILKMGFRVGDNAPMAYVELLDRPEVSDAEEAPTAE